MRHAHPNTESLEDNGLCRHRNGKSRTSSNWTSFNSNSSEYQNKVSSLHGYPVSIRSNVLIPSVPLFQGFLSAYYFHNFDYEMSSCMCIYYCFIIYVIQPHPLCGRRWLIFQESGHPCHLRRVNGPQASHGLTCYTRRSPLLPGNLSPAWESQIAAWSYELDAAPPVSTDTCKYLVQVLLACFYVNNHVLWSTNNFH